ncbi:MAG: hypothetical protein ACRYF4_02755 [Janthinobacterium lividum]
MSKQRRNVALCRLAIPFRLTENWVELSVRFLCPNHQIRGIKDHMSRGLTDNLQKAGIGIASGNV